MPKGTVKFYSEQKGFGILSDESGGKDVFVQHKGLIDLIETGDKVTYEVEQARKGPNAVDVKRIY